MICEDYVRIGETYGQGDAGRTYEQLIAEVSDISGRSLRQMVASVFPQDTEIQQMINHRLNGMQHNNYLMMMTKQSCGVCGTCYNLLEQVKYIFSLFSILDDLHNLNFVDLIAFIIN